MLKSTTGGVALGLGRVIRRLMSQVATTYRSLATGPCRPPRSATTTTRRTPTIPGSWTTTRCQTHTPASPTRPRLRRSFRSVGSKQSRSRSALSSRARGKQAKRQSIRFEQVVQAVRAVPRRFPFPRLARALSARPGETRAEQDQFSTPLEQIITKSSAALSLVRVRAACGSIRASRYALRLRDFNSAVRAPPAPAVLP